MKAIDQMAAGVKTVKNRFSLSLKAAAPPWPAALPVGLASLTGLRAPG